MLQHESMDLGQWLEVEWADESFKEWLEGNGGKSSGDIHVYFSKTNTRLIVFPLSESLNGIFSYFLCRYNTKTFDFSCYSIAQVK